MGNLIERLGGYEETKEYLKENSCFMSFEALEGFYDTLLEYRRQHNMYEIGDLVTYKAYFKGVWREGFGKITEIDEDLEVVNIDDNVGVSISEIEHATNEEIKARRRL